ncbi:hypothetical protein C1646_749915 [Rhizophagus diaphanus]|nr:hypothetical protein C1646_749915 [Rhizophagus diaphanus] [Rhizophagus sp. MUCL 43196]
MQVSYLEENFELSSKDYHSIATDKEAPTCSSKFKLHCQRGEDCQIHVWCVDSLQAGVEKRICTQNENEEYENIGKLSGFCTNERAIKDLQTTIGELRRVCVYRHDVSERTMCMVPKGSERVESKGLGYDLSMVVDTFVDESVRRNLASSIWCDLSINSSDPEKLSYYYECVAEFGFNHIIVIGEMLYGLLFLDCYGRVFQWENMEQVLWPVGDSLENTKSHEDLVIWTVEDGVVYEKPADSLKPRKITSVKGTKNNRSKKKKKR